ncbi:HD-GYP domain-containing protein [Alkalihalobacillus sp. AL-G]|uniref:HD-GYP domain-containing protein n=1 Tax=Alkalihalobacillus sp. AL-G TaxID=2926399 RepID=UPI002729A445|nr:HD domain-containing phosphohydrolase [Alkalihalobacillus sp. AL-G]WLD94003.1 HD domain-containing protein [Alkalihalobacillus sp. AL-G]
MKIIEQFDVNEFASLVGKHPNTVEEWFSKMEEKLIHYVQRINNEKVYDQNDLKLALFINDKREEKWSFDEIFKKLVKINDLRPFPSEEASKESTTIDINFNSRFERDPESLFFEIAQDNEVIQMFKYHSLRVMYIASMLAKRAECYDEDLRVAALLHDIGKMGVSKNILLKPEKLSDLEYIIIQSHSHIGNVIVRKRLGLTQAARYIRDHHEWWDGGGYPRRLVGDEISVQGRIISICDAFDTMTIDRRNYKKTTLTYDEAFSELRRCSWTQFDGNLVNMFIAMMSEAKIPEFMLNEV